MLRRMLAASDTLSCQAACRSIANPMGPNLQRGAMFALSASAGGNHLGKATDEVACAAATAGWLSSSCLRRSVSQWKLRYIPKSPGAVRLPWDLSWSIQA
jgi:hypothetical protein